jgi:pimeloyl-ACP methyl ester carboxylesterase
MKQFLTSLLARMKRLLAVILMGLLVLYIVGVIREARLEAHEWNSYTPVGRVIEVNSRQMHIYCIGESKLGQLVIILEAGLGDSLFTWYSIQPAISQMARVCSYDRSGYGWSDPASGPRTASIIADELHVLLKAAGIDGPYLLVGHSFGGLCARMFASHYPKEVATLVLVDSLNAEELARLPSWSRGPLLFIPALETGLGSILEAAGVLRWLAEMNAIELPLVIEHLPSNLQAEAKAQYYRTQTLITAYTEQRATAQSAVLSHESGDLGTMPVIALVAATNLDNQSKAEYEADIDTLSTNSRVVFVEDSPHYIHLVRPTIVLNTILEALQIAEN